MVFMDSLNNMCVRVCGGGGGGGGGGGLCVWRGVVCVEGCCVWWVGVYVCVCLVYGVVCIAYILYMPWL